jgi:hypothetical protein
MSDLDELKAEWFEFGRKAGLREAEERAIKVIEKHNSGCLCGVVAVCYPHRLIALIKEEK